jgi:tetratricopeptide (TPR) repeat protein
LAQPERAIQDPAAMIRIADAAEQSGDSAGAAAFYRRAAELQPDSVAAQIGVARSLAEQDRVDEAIDSLRSAHARAPSDTQVTVTLGRLLIAAGRPSEALDTFGDGLRQDPRSVPLLIAQGVALDTIGRHAEAQASYKEALTISPDSAAAKKDLALSLAQARKGDGAASRRVPEPHPDDVR